MRSDVVSANGATIVLSSTSVGRAPTATAGARAAADRRKARGVVPDGHPPRGVGRASAQLTLAASVARPKNSASMTILRHAVFTQRELAREARGAPLRTFATLLPPTVSPLQSRKAL